MEQSGKRITAQKSMQTSIIETSLCKFPCTLLHCLLSHTHNHRLCVKGIHLNLYRLHSPAAEALPCSGLPKLASAPGAMNAIPSALWCVARSAPSCCPHITCHTHTQHKRLYKITPALLEEYMVCRYKQPTTCRDQAPLTSHIFLANHSV